MNSSDSRAFNKLQNNKKKLLKKKAKTNKQKELFSYTMRNAYSLNTTGETTMQKIDNLLDKSSYQRPQEYRTALFLYYSALIFTGKRFKKYSRLSLQCRKAI